MDQGNETLAVLIFLIGVALAVLAGLLWQHAWEIHEKRKMCPHLHTRDLPAMGEMKRFCDDCGGQWFLHWTDCPPDRSDDGEV